MRVSAQAASAIGRETVQVSRLCGIASRRRRYCPPLPSLHAGHACVQPGPCMRAMHAGHACLCSRDLANSGGVAQEAIYRCGPFCRMIHVVSKGRREGQRVHIDPCPDRAPSWLGRAACVMRLVGAASIASAAKRSQAVAGELLEVVAHGGTARLATSFRHGWRRRRRRRRLSRRGVVLNAAPRAVASDDIELRASEAGAQEVLANSVAARLTATRCVDCIVDARFDTQGSKRSGAEPCKLVDYTAQGPSWRRQRWH